MRLKDGFVIRQIADAWVVVPIGSRVIDFNGLISLNETGAFIWNQLEKNVTREGIISSLCEEYQIDGCTAEKDLGEFLDIMKKKDLIIQ